MFRDLTICRSEEVYADRGMLEVDPVIKRAKGQSRPSLTVRSAWSPAEQHQKYRQLEM
jgi:hypothetical protein